MTAFSHIRTFFNIEGGSVTLRGGGGSKSLPEETEHKKEGVRGRCFVARISRGITLTSSP